jgi:hypothetical protein
MIVSQRLCRIGTHKIFVSYPEEFFPTKTFAGLQSKKADGGAGRLIFCCQPLDEKEAVVFRGMYEILCGISKFLCIYFTISCGTTMFCGLMVWKH